MSTHTTAVERQQCTAKSKSTGVRCRSYPMRGGKVCRVHGGSAIQVRQAAQRRLAVEKVEGEVKNALAFESLTGIDDPLEALSRLADESMAMKEALASRVNSLKQLRYSAHGPGTEQLRAEVQLYERALDRTAKFLSLLVASNFEERKTALGERQGRLAAEALRRIFKRLNLTPAQEILIGTVVPEEFRRMAEIETSR